MTINRFLNNPLLDTDSYKPSHPQQYPAGTTGMFSYIESRGGADEILWFGLQIILKEVFSKPITAEMVEEAAQFYQEHGEPFYKEGWMYVVERCNGYIPVTIRAVPEGLIIPTKNLLASLECTDQMFVKCMQHLETLLLRVWYPSTVATISWNAKQQIKAAMEQSCDNLDGLPFKLHDFGSRGVSSPQSAAIGGCSHLVNFMGSDTVLGILGAREWYGERMAGFSIPASEHSTMTSWGLTEEGETAAFRNMINAFGNGPIFACVSDARDIENACRGIWGGTLKEEVLKMNATLVIRPDSGDPIYWLPRLLNVLDEQFGSTTNTKGYKVLNKVRLIQGDGVTKDSLPVMLQAILDAGYSIDNVAFGMGGGLLQHCNRDTYKWAMKCSAIRINDEWFDVYKDPVTDPGKVSKKGRLSLFKGDGGYYTGNPNEVTMAAVDQIVYMYDKATGKPAFNDISFMEVRNNSNL